MPMEKEGSYGVYDMLDRDTFWSTIKGLKWLKKF